MAARPPSHLTVRNLPADLARALRAERQRRGSSLNRTVIELLAGALGVRSARSRSNGLEALAGTWDDAGVAEFEAATAPFERIDDEIWR